MTTVNDFTDILRIIREQPEWGEALRAALLSQEVLEMPQRLAALTVAFTEFAENTNRRLAALEGDVAELKGDVVELKGDVAELKGDVAVLKVGQARLEGAVSRLEGQVGNLRGNSYEQRIGDTISSIMTDRMNIRVRALKRSNLADDSEFFDLLHGAEGRGVISRQERNDLANADIVLQERGHPDADPLYVVIEVSTTVANDDVIRSYERASILQRATGTRTIPVVVGANVDEARQRLAQERNVTLITVSE